MKWYFYTLFGALIFLIGIVAGMLIGTYAVIDHVAYGLAGSTFIVNFNETRMVDYTLQKMNETIIPQIVHQDKCINWEKNFREEDLTIPNLYHSCHCEISTGMICCDSIDVTTDIATTKCMENGWIIIK